METRPSGAAAGAEPAPGGGAPNDAEGIVVGVAHDLSAVSLTTALLLELPLELQQRVASFCRAAQLARLAGCSAACARLSAHAVRAALHERRPELCRCPPSPCALAELLSLERLEARLGPRPARPWASEWDALTKASMGVSVSIDAVEAFVRPLIDAAVAIGWREEVARPSMLVGFSHRHALADAVRDGRREFAASLHLLCDVIGAQGRRMPPARAARFYRNLTGEGGLCSDDATWGVLCGEGVRPGLTFTSFTIVIADGSARNFESERGYGVLALEAHGAAASYICQDSDVVAFESAPSDSEGHHALLPTGGDSGAMPPLSTIRVVRVDAPGEWEAFGKVVQQKLITVAVTWA
ncbi:hypothetical protein AB1Y20_013895 [Prymnesium parvum]|uniref:Mono(ADP-ribosyl)transferase n=1 Tax=Prymnesium parvum TaxID=97485 RepID=A0AB34IFH1_PRYPA